MNVTIQMCDNLFIFLPQVTFFALDGCKLEKL